MTTYILIVYPKPPTMRGQTDAFYAQGSTETRAPRVNRIQASSESNALAESKIQPGEYALVVELDKMRRFDRATQAPLVQVAPNGQPFPEEAPDHA